MGEGGFLTRNESAFLSRTLSNLMFFGENHHGLFHGDSDLRPYLIDCFGKLMVFFGDGIILIMRTEGDFHFVVFV